MTLVASLIANPNRPAITDAVLAEARRVLGTEHQPRILRRGVAAELLVAGATAEARGIEDRLRAALAAEPIDVAVLSGDSHRRKRLLLADMDSTMIEQECIDELAGTLGLRDRIAAITERAMRGEIAFEPALRERVGLLAGLDVSVIDNLIRDTIRATPGGATLVATMRAHGARTCLVSGGFTLFAEPIGARLGFDEVRATVLGVSGDRLTGTVEEPIVGRETKRATLIALRDRLGLQSEATLAVGDGANDLAMLREAGLGVAFRAKPAVAAAAHARVRHGDLTALLYLQGFAASEFVG